jgi:hypothetical protein
MLIPLFYAHWHIICEYIKQSQKTVKQCVREYLIEFIVIRSLYSCTSFSHINPKSYLGGGAAFAKKRAVMKIFISPDKRARAIVNGTICSFYYFMHMLLSYG